MASGSKTVIYAALVGNGAIAVGKFAVAGITGSSAMFSEGVHSLVDTGNQVLLLLGLRRAGRPPDAGFPFGHGKEVYFWSFVVAISIFGLGAGISIYEGIHRMLEPQPLENVAWSYGILCFAIAAESVAWYLAFREFNAQRGERSMVDAVRHGKDPTLFVVLFEDTAAMMGLLVALVGTLATEWTGALWIDGLASVVIGLILAGTAAWLARETMGLLIGEGASAEVVASIEAIADRAVRVERVNEVLTLHMGPEFLLVNLSVDFIDDLAVGEVEQSIARIDRAIKEAHPEVKRVFIEAALSPPPAEPRTPE